jgi:hypothetical protein
MLAEVVTGLNLPENERFLRVSVLRVRFLDFFSFLLEYIII